MNWTLLLPVAIFVHVHERDTTFIHLITYEHLAVALVSWRIDYDAVVSLSHDR
jgi:hypothetical protein